MQGHAYALYEVVSAASAQSCAETEMSSSWVGLPRPSSSEPRYYSGLND